MKPKSNALHLEAKIKQLESRIEALKNEGKSEDLSIIDEQGSEWKIHTLEGGGIFVGCMSGGKGAVVRPMTGSSVSIYAVRSSFWKFGREVK